MPVVIDALEELPAGSHCLSFHVDRLEAREHAIAFLAGAPAGQAATYWVTSDEQKRFYEAALASRSPGQLGCVAILDHEQVERAEGRLRPAAEVRSFLALHPDGVTAAGETITQYWTPGCISDHLEYEAWFQDQPNENSRFLCPYGLPTIAGDRAVEVVRSLGAHHSHIALSKSQHPAVRLLQLFVFPSLSEISPQLVPIKEWAISEGYVEIVEDRPDLSLTEAGERVVRQWSQRDS
ncbi:MAG TPA: hypothetical protein VGX00_01635 [Thermoplasmata archaeon]|nr:hypothetical protein [Thermoplasmata archaeon]